MQHQYNHKELQDLVLGGSTLDLLNYCSGTLNNTIKNASEEGLQIFITDIKTWLSSNLTELPSIEIIQSITAFSLGRIFFLSSTNPEIQNTLNVLLQNDTFIDHVIKKAKECSEFACQLKQMFAEDNKIKQIFSNKKFDITTAQEVTFTDPMQQPYSITQDLNIINDALYKAGNPWYSNDFLKKDILDDLIANFLETHKDDARLVLTKEAIADKNNPANLLMYYAIEYHLPKTSQALINITTGYCMPHAYENGDYTNFLLEALPHHNLTVINQLLAGYKTTLPLDQQSGDLLPQFQNGNNLVYMTEDTDIRSFLIETSPGVMADFLQKINEDLGNVYLLFWSNRLSIAAKQKCFEFLNDVNNIAIRDEWYTVLKNNWNTALYLIQDITVDIKLNINNNPKLQPLVDAFFIANDTLNPEYKKALAAEDPTQIVDETGAGDKDQTPLEESSKTEDAKDYVYLLPILKISLATLVGGGAGYAAYVFLPETCRLVFPLAGAAIPGGAIIVGLATLLLAYAISEGVHRAIQHYSVPSTT